MPSIGKLIQVSPWRRIGLLCVGVFGLYWSASAFYETRRSEPLHVIADRMLRGRDYEREALAPLIAYLDRSQKDGCSLASSDIAVIRLHAAAVAQEGKAGDAPTLLERARQSTLGALACSPHDPYLWYALFWVTRTQGAQAEKLLPPLAMSYELAPHEGWINQFRAADAWHLFPAMPEALREKVRRELRNLVRDSPRAAAAALRDSDENARKAMLSTLEEVPLKDRETLAKELDRRDVTIDIPGVDYNKWYRR